MPQRHQFLTRTVLYSGDERFVLVMWDAQSYTSTGQMQCGYILTHVGRGVLFRSERDYGCAPGHPIDSEDSVRGLLGFLTLQPGDTDDEYFEDYTEEQMAFAQEHGEELSLHTLDEDPIPFWAFEWL